MQQDVALVWTYLPHLLPATKNPAFTNPKQDLWMRGIPVLGIYPR